MRASNARPYGVDCTSDDNVGATIGRPLLRLNRKSVTVPAHLITLPMCVANCPYGNSGFLRSFVTVPLQ